MCKSQKALGTSSRQRRRGANGAESVWGYGKASNGAVPTTIPVACTKCEWMMPKKHHTCTISNGCVNLLGNAHCAWLTQADGARPLKSGRTGRKGLKCIRLAASGQRRNRKRSGTWRLRLTRASHQAARPSLWCVRTQQDSLASATEWPRGHAMTSRATRCQQPNRPRRFVRLCAPRLEIHTYPPRGPKGTTYDTAINIRRR